MALYFVFLILFYYRYVPLVIPFQAAFLPVLLVVFLLTLVKAEWGFLAFVAVLPLINSLPYFFGIHEHIPHAPTALTLFLIFFLAWWLRRLFVPSPPANPPALAMPLVLLAVLIAVSGVITFLRYANFPPLLSDRIHEIIVNENSLRAGGALMSVVFSSLSYLSGFLFYTVAWSTLRSRRLARQTLIVLAISISGSLVFALLQRYYSLELGNSPAWIHLRQINGTFKDPNSFGAVLSLFFPVLLGLLLSLKKGAKFLPLLVIIAVLLTFPSIGSRSALLGTMIASLVFLSLLAVDSHIPSRKKLSYGVLFAGLLLVFLFILLVGQQSSLSKRLRSNVGALTASLDIKGLLMGRADLWMAATRMMRDYPLTGVGEGGYIVELPNYLKMLNRPFPSTDSAENYFLQVGAELGLAGLLLTLWLFWAIGKRTVAAGRHRLEGGADRFILIGGMSGIVGLLVNFLFHSYIGAFEVQYIFWLLVAIVASWPAFDCGAGIREKFPPVLKWAALSLAILYAGIHLWNSFHSLSLTARTDRFGWDQDFGLYELERDNRVVFFRWAKKSAGMSVSRLGQAAVVPLLVSHPDVQENPVRVRIYRADRYFRKKALLREVIFREKAWTDFEYPLPVSGEGKHRLVFETDRSWEPAKVSGVPDPRSLAIGLGEIWFRYPSEWAEEKSGPVEKTVFREWEGKFGADLIGFGTSRIKFFSPSGGSALKLRAKGQKALEVGPMILIRVDDEIVAKTMLTADDWVSLVLAPGPEEGEHVLSVEFTNDFYDPESGADRNVFLGPLEILKRR